MPARTTASTRLVSSLALPLLVGAVRVLDGPVPAIIGQQHVEERSAATGRFANVDVIEKLFGKLGASDGADDEGDDEEGADLTPMSYDAEDDAFLGVVAKVLEVIDESDDGRIGKAELAEAARDEEYPHFEAFVESLFDEADRDGDGLLEGVEAEELVESVRLHVAREVLGAEDGEDGAALDRVLDTLDAHPDGGVQKQSLVEASTTRFYPELAELVGGLFDDSDWDRDGALSPSEIGTFKILLADIFIGDEDVEASLGVGQASDEEADLQEAKTMDDDDDDEAPQVDGSISDEQASQEGEGAVESADAGAAGEDLEQEAPGTTEHAGGEEVEDAEEDAEEQSELEDEGDVTDSNAIAAAGSFAEDRGEEDGDEAADDVAFASAEKDDASFAEGDAALEDEEQ